MEQNANFYFNQALEKFRNREVKSGLDDLEQAIRLDQSHWEYYWTRGAFNYRRRRYQLAETDLTEAINLCLGVKQVRKVYERRMFCYGFLKRYERLVEDANWLIEHGFNKALIYHWRAWGKYEIGDVSGAIKDYSAGINLFPDYFFIRMDRATLNYRLQNFSEALNDFNYILQSPYIARPFADVIYQYRALTFYHLGDLKKSFDDFTQFQKLVKNEPFSDMQTYVDSIKDSVGTHFSGINMPSRPSDGLRSGKTVYYLSAQE